jgi:hypothetical protein
MIPTGPLASEKPFVRSMVPLLSSAAPGVGGD